MTTGWDGTCLQNHIASAEELFTVCQHWHVDALTVAFAGLVQHSQAVLSSCMQQDATFCFTANRLHQYAAGLSALAMCEVYRPGIRVTALCSVVMHCVLACCWLCIN